MLISLTSVSGSPGVSTTAVGLALMWPRDVILLEADTVGASPTLAGFFAGSVPPKSTVLDLVPGADFEEQLMRRSLPLTEEQSPLRRLVPGISNPLHGKALSTRWDALALALYDLDRAGIDVITDIGRIHSPYLAAPILQASDVSVLTLRPTITSTLTARTTIKHRRLAEDDGLSAPAFHLLTVSAPDTYSPSETSRALHHPTVGSLPWAPKHAAALAHGRPRPRGFDTSSYARNLRSLADAISAAGQKRRTAIQTLRGATR
ncbi:MinD/ParA family ATP-binding protein [Brachybacterium sacelli]|uniref:ParA family protein n=1 Tax=Brachybacterium sacelli TaxID=173364 RepID=A0ABS4WWT1_9MICO|nr:hypothetical protein [Brachybacterium sacelli]MBP2380669.1 hypothetical protein [Brachybacterium sacelli]